MKPRTRTTLFFSVAATLTALTALTWVAQIWWQAEVKPSSRVLVGMGGGMMKLCIDGNEGVRTLFPSANHVEGFGALDEVVSHRSTPLGWGFQAHAAADRWLYILAVPMWAPLALFSLVAVHFRLQQKFIDKLGHQRCTNCGQDRRKVRQGSPCPGCGKKLVQAWAA